MLYCLHHDSQLGWIIDPDEYSILVLLPNQAPQVCRGDRPLIVLDGINITLTEQQVFGWLKVQKNTEFTGL